MKIDDEDKNELLAKMTTTRMKVKTFYENNNFPKSLRCMLPLKRNIRFDTESDNDQIDARKDDCGDADWIEMKIRQMEIRR